MKIKELKSFLEKVVDKDIDKLSSDYNANGYCCVIECFEKVLRFE